MPALARDIHVGGKDEIVFDAGAESSVAAGGVDFEALGGGGVDGEVEGHGQAEGVEAGTEVRGRWRGGEGGAACSGLERAGMAWGLERSCRLG